MAQLGAMMRTAILRVGSVRAVITLKWPETITIASTGGRPVCP
ncbi:hypothetical protein ACIQOW_01380 [Kitasatospora sp. NPDC091335]